MAPVLNWSKKASCRSSPPTATRTSAPRTPDAAPGYKNLLEAERGFRDLKSTLLLRPVFHRLEHRIRAHVLICWLALLLVRVAERGTGHNWENKGEETKLRMSTQRILDETLAASPDHAQQRFANALADSVDAAGDTGLSSGTGTPPDRVSQPGHAPGAATALHRGDGDQLAPLDPSCFRNRLVASVLPMMVAGGRGFTGSVIHARVLPAADDGRIVATLPAVEPDTWTAGWPGRELLVGVVERDVDVFGMDSRRAARRGGHRRRTVADPAGLPARRPHCRLLWAVTNLDTSLLGDDAQLATCHERASRYEQLPSSSASRDALASLSRVSQMWLGSQFCARHILRHRDSLAGLPAFWTREQQGEEASTWLLFTHKYHYLERLADRHRSRTEPMTRTFAITETAITTSPPPHRAAGWPPWPAYWTWTGTG